MARIISLDPQGTFDDAFASWNSNTGVSIVTAENGVTPRHTSNMLKVDTSSTGDKYAIEAHAGLAEVYGQIYFHPSNAEPTGNCVLVRVTKNTTPIYDLFFRYSGGVAQVAMSIEGGSTYAGSWQPLNDGVRWYRLEWRFVQGSGSDAIAQLMIDGTFIENEVALSTTSDVNRHYVGGYLISAGSGQYYLDAIEVDHADRIDALPALVTGPPPIIRPNQFNFDLF